MNIVLCGMMGCGKTTVGRILSQRYNLTFADTDELICARYGSIDGIFASHGEKYFRNIEALVTAEVAASYSNAVISLGGGCVLRAENVQNLKKSGKLFYLRASAEELVKRLKGDTTRPLIKGDVEGRVRSILSQRAHVYEAVADVIIDTEGAAPEEIAEKIKEMTI